MILYKALYTSCIFESAAATLSVHLTRIGAELAVKRHRQETIDQFRRDGYELKQALWLIQNHWWDIEELQVQP